VRWNLVTPHRIRGNAYSRPSLFPFRFEPPPCNPCLFCKFRTLLTLPSPGSPARKPRGINRFHTLAMNKAEGGSERRRRPLWRGTFRGAWPRRASPQGSCSSFSFLYVITSILHYLLSSTLTNMDSNTYEKHTSKSNKVTLCVTSKSQLAFFKPLRTLSRKHAGWGSNPLPHRLAAAGHNREGDISAMRWL
jgi:hypothetical protein